VKDVTGRELKPGQRVVYAAVDGRSAAIRFGTVVEIVPPNPKTWQPTEKCRVQVDKKASKQWGRSISSGFERPVLLQYEERILILDPE